MNALARHISDTIRIEGPLSLSAFMTMVLHDRHLGFYSAHESIGAHGAFVTAPEISQMFGELLGLWCAEIWRMQGGARSVRLVELGPGRGTLMRDALRAISSVPDFLGGIDVVLVEASCVLETLQREHLRDASVPIRWVRQWSDVGQDRPLFILANEFLDALPIRQFVMTANGWCERTIATDPEGELVLALAPDPTPLATPATRGDAALGAVYEISIAAEALVEEIACRIAGSGGAALFIDYGHAGVSYGDTLQAVARHKYVDVLASPGGADLSAHVDFGALVRCVKQTGACAHGPVAQGSFLRGLGIETRARQLSTQNSTKVNEIDAGMRRLIAPDEMGELFKVLAIMPAISPPPPGFETC